MRIIVFSDTHGNYPEAIKAVDDASPVDLIVHLGDELQDASFIAMATGIPVLMVAGNCDPGHPAPRERCEELDGLRVFMTHGDRYHVKAGTAALTKKALAEKARIALFGHTHLPMIQDQEGVLLVNPGTLSKRGSSRNFALLIIDNGSVAARIVTLPSTD
jgi:uncharacterized protein